ncbi:E3 ubiquitin-protein ligase MARCHF2-like isoform X2 [Plodia interpunctella]|uniref:E3 ubiquitin-protein ligase MARCHF2-like isoform X2 n=1 Tax=Plodia interpunctella TaxID=58824 RepID=UPI0023686898|nr:E3 ubiquitin-protein ligase MARCHF2-like isoform X2 [Plodia interpunctella]
MPNTRRRRFSVQNKVVSSNPTAQNEAHSRKTNQENSRNVKQRRKFAPNTTPPVLETLEIVTECASVVSLETPSATKKHNDDAVTVDKDVTASSSNIDFFNIMSATDDNESVSSSKETIIVKETPNKNKDNSVKERTDNDKQSRDRMSFRKDKLPRPHRVKVRSPKRSITILETKPETKDTIAETRDKIPEVICCSVEVDAINWTKELQDHSIPEVVTNVVEVADEIRESEHSLDDMCRICHGGEALSAELGQLISACSCRGTVARVHVKCLERWLTESGKSRCELCGTRYITRRVHRYGVPRALVMWILSQNAKQLMVDSLGIMLMSPLAVLAAWLSGRTLAGLMTQESHVTPWPLASTFVLACMTLVCYYCWIVSAATRHALSWWIWYRSQYEVRLQLQDSDE